MSFHRLISVIRRLLGRERAWRGARWRSSAAAKAVLLAVVLAGTAGVASASVLVSGDVTPSDNPFTLNINEGLPSDGNFVNPFEAEDEQTFFEGRHLDNNVADPLDDTNVNIPDIIVGQSAYGTLLISGESALRDQTLTVGGSGPRATSGGGGGVIRAGTGVMRITGFGSLYNNDPTIIPPGLPANFSSKTPRPIDVGYDLYVGIAGTPTDPTLGANVGGTGTFEISAGGRAEIQDAVVVGRDPNSTGYIVVDGFDSYLGSGGFAAGGGGGSLEPHQMIIGLRGVGYMTISNGATVRTDAPPAAGGSGGSTGPVGAVIGSPVFETGNQCAKSGGVGTVTVSGPASKWIVSGSLQIGGFNFGQTGQVVAGDPEGDGVLYSSAAGRGTLNVQAGAVVNLINALGIDANDPQLLLAIGRFGRIQMDGGLINVGGVTGENNDTEVRENSVQLINDGVISGSGRINTGVFNNRYFGEIRVGGGEKLLIDASADLSAGTGSPVLTNYGVIQVLGTGDLRAELEFDRAGRPSFADPAVSEPAS